MSPAILALKIATQFKKKKKKMYDTPAYDNVTNTRGFPLF